MLIILLSILQISLPYNWIVSDSNRSSLDISSDAFLKIVLYPLDTMEMRLKSPDVWHFCSCNFQRKPLVKSTNFSLTAKMNSLEIRVKALTAKISFRNMFGNSFGFVRKSWFMIPLDINSNKQEGPKTSRRDKIF